MPVLAQSGYTGPPPHLFTAYLQTIVPNVLRRFPRAAYQRERILLPDGDFLDLDWWCEHQTDKLAILTHGLEGNSERPYIRTMARILLDHGWDVLAWNCRSCSDDINIAPRLYYHGDTDDIESVVHHAIRSRGYAHLSLIGMSMGGSINLKYAGVCQLPENVRSVVAISTPCRLSAAAEAMDNFWNRMIFKPRFMKGLREKMRIKAAQHPGTIDLSRFDQVKSWRDWDEWFSAPMFGFANADELYDAGSAQHFIPDIEIPALILNAYNDPILPEDSHPHEACADSQCVWLEMTNQGGHVGFPEAKFYYTYAERRTLSFLQQHY